MQYSKNIQTLQHIFHILLRVICNDVIDRLSRCCCYWHCMHVWIWSLAIAFAGGHGTLMNMFYQYCSLWFSIQKIHCILPPYTAHNYAHPIRSSLSFNSFNCNTILPSLSRNSWLMRTIFHGNWFYWCRFEICRSFHFQYQFGYSDKYYSIKCMQFDFSSRTKHQRFPIKCF